MHALPASSLTAKEPALFVAEDVFRQTVLDGFGSLDTPEQQEYDDAVKLAASICDTPAASISFVDRDRQWFKARIGVDAWDGPRALSFCAHAIRTPDEVMIVPDASQDPRFASQMTAAGDLAIRFYAGAPLVAPMGAALGTICVFDRTTRQLTESQTDALRILARQVVRQLELGQANAALRTANAKLTEISVTDALTGIQNRRAFNQRLAEEEARANRTGQPFCLLLLDVDRFKAFNDRFGHQAGDEALRRIAAILKTGNRPYDFVARYGGEEFALILSQTSLADAALVADRLRAAVAAASMPLERLTLSIGVARYEPEAGAAALIAAADRAMYAAKAGGRNRVTVAAPLSAPA